ncbi:Na+/H+ antiporter NhaC [Wenyingzhuangia sp. IMCC45574]
MTSKQSLSINFSQSLVPVITLISLLAYNIFFADGALLGDYSNQYILVFSALVALVIGIKLQTPIKVVSKAVYANLKSVFIPILILFLVGALAGSWLISGIIPMMVHYGLDFLSASYFLPCTVLIAALVSVVTGSSWTTSATVGIALIGVGTTLGIDKAIIAGAVISGSYFGDKISPLSDTTYLASAISGTNLYTHIRYLSLTTIPSLVITLIAFFFLSPEVNLQENAQVLEIQTSILKTFKLSPWLLTVPLLVILLIVFKVKPLLSFVVGIGLACLFAVIFQNDLIQSLTNSSLTTIKTAILTDIQITTDNDLLNELFSSGGMKGMIWTVLLIVSAMIFGGVMDGIGALSTITKNILAAFTSVFGLFTSTVISCIGLNVVASDQYLAIAIPGKMFKKAYEDKKLAPENLSRTLEDSGTVTSVLIPWNTCGAYETKVLGVSTGDYFMYAIFNYVSPLMTLLFAGLGLKIRQLKSSRL